MSALRKGNIGGRLIAYLSDHEDVRVLPEKPAENRVEGHAYLVVRLDLADARYTVLDGILDRDDLPVGAIQLVQDGAQGRGLAAPRRSGDQDEAMREAHERAEVMDEWLIEAEPPQIPAFRVPVEEAQYDRLAMDRRDDGDAKLHGPVADHRVHLSIPGEDDAR